jgi:hypothetical protein
MASPWAAAAWWSTRPVPWSRVVPPVRVDLAVAAAVAAMVVVAAATAAVVVDMAVAVVKVAAATVVVVVMAATMAASAAPTVHPVKVAVVAVESIDSQPLTH